MNESDYIGFGLSTDGARHEINHLPINPTWEPGIYQWEASDYVIGGRNGVDNLPTQQLANRTEWLKRKAESLTADLETIGAKDKYNELLAMIKSLDATSSKNRINHLERLVGNLYLVIKANKMNPDGYDGLIAETFDDAKEVDQTVVMVESVVSGDDSLDVEDSSNLIIGAIYQLTDGEHIEEVQIKSINVSGRIKRVVLTGNVKNQYAEGRAKLYRSSVAIYNGRAYGGGNKRVDKWEAKASFSGSNTQNDIRTSVSFADKMAFEIVGATVENDKMILGTQPVGVVMLAEGGGSGKWKQIDEEGNDLA